MFLEEVSDEAGDAVAELCYAMGVILIGDKRYYRGESALLQTCQVAGKELVLNPIFDQELDVQHDEPPPRDGPKQGEFFAQERRHA